MKVGGAREGKEGGRCRCSSCTVQVMAEVQVGEQGARCRWKPRRKDANHEPRSFPNPQTTGTLGLWTQEGQVRAGHVRSLQYTSILVHPSSPHSQNVMCKAMQCNAQRARLVRIWQDG